MPRAALLSAAAILLAALASPAVLAQVPQPGVTVTLDSPSVELGVSNSTTLTGTVTYTDTAPAVPGAGTTAGTVDLTVSVPDGWNASIEPASLALSPGQSATFTLTLTSPATGAASETLDASVEAAAQSPDGRSASASAPFAISFVIPPPPPVIPWYQTPIGIAGIVLAVLLVIGVVAFILYRNRQKRLAAERAQAERAAYLDRETGITIALASGPLQYGHKREVVYRLAIANASKRPRVALLDVVEVTNGWRASTQISKIPLSIGETQHATLVVTPDAVITPGDIAKVVVRARPEEAREKDERLTLEVHAPKHGVPADPHYRIVTVHREGANNPVAKR